MRPAAFHTAIAAITGATDTSRKTRRTSPKTASENRSPRLGRFRSWRLTNWPVELRLRGRSHRFWQAEVPINGQWRRCGWPKRAGPPPLRAPERARPSCSRSGHERHDRTSWPRRRHREARACRGEDRAGHLGDRDVGATPAYLNGQGTNVGAATGLVSTRRVSGRLDGRAGDGQDPADWVGTRRSHMD